MPSTPIPPRFHVLAKPSGATCNLACSYCFFLDKELLYPDSKFRMTEEILEAYIKHLIEAHRSNQVTVAWQGGEPTLMEVQSQAYQHAKPEQPCPCSSGLAFKDCHGWVRPKRVRRGRGNTMGQPRPPVRAEMQQP